MASSNPFVRSSIIAGDVAADDQRADTMGTFVGVEGFVIQHVAKPMVIVPSNDLLTIAMQACHETCKALPKMVARNMRRRFSQSRPDVWDAQEELNSSAYYCAKRVGS